MRAHRHLAADRHLRAAAAVAVAAVAVALVAGASPGVARAETRAFSAGSLVIPMDYCYQPQVGNGGFASAAACPDPRGVPDDGLMRAYGLVYRLVASGIPVYLVIDPAKSAIDGVDLTITAPAGAPVGLLDHASGASGAVLAPGHTSVSYRGAPFVVDATDADRVVKVLAADLAGPRTFAGVDVHVARQDFLAPLKSVLSQMPPRIALLNIGGAAIGVLEGYLKDAGLYTGTAIATYPAIGDVFTELQRVSDFTTSRALVAGGFHILWAPHWQGDLMAPADRTGIVQAISDFVDAGHPFFAECASIATIEGTSGGPGNWSSSQNGVPGNFLTTAVAPKRALVSNHLPQPTWPSRPGEGVAFNAAALSSPLAQVGDYTFELRVASHTFDFVPAADAGVAYHPGVLPVLTSTAPLAEPDLIGRDIEVMGHKDDDLHKGLVIYLGGHSYGSQGSICTPRCTTFPQEQSIVGERLVLNTLLFLGQIPHDQELTRSSPIVTADGHTYQGSYLEQSVAQAGYPPWRGHFRQYPTRAINGLTTAFDKVAADWDAANHVPPAARRVVFTAVAGPAGAWSQVPLDTASAARLGPAMKVAARDLARTIDGIRAGGFGGVDHSTPALVPPSTAAGSPTRPTVAYVGALDGMLHAVLVSGDAGGAVPGTELWAFVPPSQLGRIATYGAGVDGSPSVADAFIEVSPGRRAWRTLLAVPCGDFGGTVSMLDVTDPLAPVFLWEGGAPGGQYVMGAARGAAFGVIPSARGGRASALFLATNNAGNAGAGINVYALDAGTGAPLWRWSHLYTRIVPGLSIPVPNDVPAVPAVTNLAGDGGLDDRLYVGDLDGRLWELDATQRSGPPAAPLWDVGAPGQPIATSVAVYRDALTRHLAVTGATGGSDWSPATVNPVAFAVDAQAGGRVLFRTSLGIGEHVFAAPTVAGNDVYLLTGFGRMGGDIGPTASDAGNILRIALTGGAIASATVVAKGAGEVAVATDGTVVAASAKGLSSTSNAGSNAGGLALAFRPQRPLTVRAWLDLR